MHKLMEIYWGEWDKMSLFMHCKVGNGKLVQFWKDIWCVTSPRLAMVEPLYQFFSNKEVTVEEM